MKSGGQMNVKLWALSVSPEDPSKAEQDIDHYGIVHKSEQQNRS